MTASSIQNLIQNPRLQNRFVTLIFALLTVIASILLASTADAASAEEIDARIEEAMAEFYEESSAGRALAQRAAGMLVFPRVIKAGIGIGGEYGEERCWLMVALRHTTASPRRQWVSSWACNARLR